MQICARGRDSPFESIDTATERRYGWTTILR